MTSRRVYTAGPFSLQRFTTSLDLSDENHIGEAIVRDDGRLEYLKTYRLSGAQTKRAYLLEQLSRAGWSVTEAARAVGTTWAQLVVRVCEAGFGYLFKPQIVQAAYQAAEKERLGAR